jgi:aspartate/methionine/tyrosine aminotransferase
VHPLPFPLDEGGPAAPPAAIRQQLDAAVEAAAARGIPVRGILVTNPNNPLGTLYRNRTIEEMVRWCLDNGMHYVRWERWWGLLRWCTAE